MKKKTTLEMITRANQRTMRKYETENSQSSKIKNYASALNDSFKKAVNEPEWLKNKNALFERLLNRA